MAINIKLLKTRIGSVKNTKKITRAMEMISAVKMKKSVDSALSARPYALVASQLLFDIAGAEKEFELMKKRNNGKNVALVLVTSNKGLCGNYNSAILKEAEKFIDNNTERNISVVAIGEKSRLFAKKNKLDIILNHADITDKPEFEKLDYISDTLRNMFLDKKIDQVYVISTNYVSALVTEVQLNKILPIEKGDIREMLRTSAKDDSIQKEMKEYEVNYDNFSFEPNRKVILEEVLPTLFDIRLFQLLLESSASEHSSRMIAMKNATESATEMIDDLTLQFNKGRQAAITQEISEIAAGAEAISD